MKIKYSGVWIQIQCAKLSCTGQGAPIKQDSGSFQGCSRNFPTSSPVTWGSTPQALQAMNHSGVMHDVCGGLVPVRGTFLERPCLTFRTLSKFQNKPSEWYHSSQLTNLSVQLYCIIFKIIETLIMNATAAGNIKLLSGPEKRETGAQDCFCSHQAVFYFMLT